MIGKLPPPAYISEMTDAEFDASLVTAAFAQAGEEGWRKVSPASAARRAELDLALARRRFAGANAILRRFGELADAHALAESAGSGSVRDRLFDLLLRRFDFLQRHRAGVLALLRRAPFDPGLSLWLAGETLRSMGWLLEAAGLPASGLRGRLRARGLALVWGWGIRAWRSDESEDLAATMAAVDAALARADRIAERFDIGATAAAASQDGFVPETMQDAEVAAEFLSGAVAPQTPAPPHNDDPPQPDVL